MKVRRVETIRPAGRPNLCFVRLTTESGLTGLGETYFGAAAVEAYVHETVAPYLLGQDAAAIRRHHQALAGYLGRTGSGAESRGLAATDIALWDLAGKASGRPLVDLLGGAVRDSVPVYNTCAGSDYVRGAQGQSVANWNADATGPYEDLNAFLTRAGELAKDLLAMGITGMKIWPFDPYAEASGGQHITTADLDRALEPLRQIRHAVGDDMDVMVELHGLWNLPAAEQIARALRPYAPRWLEDPIRAESPRALGELRRRIDVPIATGETLGSAREFHDLASSGGADILIVDIAWARGITAAAEVVTVAALHERPVAFHDCTGPVTLVASTHLAVATPQAFTQEIVRASLLGWYQGLVTELPKLTAGRLTPPSGPGLGTELHPDLLADPTTVVRVSER